MKEDKLDNILHYRFGANDELWIFASKNEKNEFNYQIITLIDNVPEIEMIDSPSSITQNIENSPELIQEGSIDYIRFIAIKDIVTSDIYRQMKR